MSCRFCEKAVNRGFNLRRHEKYCPLKDQEREMSETESPTMDFEDDASTTSTRGSESQITTDNETETEEEENDPWMPMVEKAMQKHKHKADFEEMKMNLIHSGLVEQSAEEIAYSNVLPMLEKELESIYMKRLLWMKQLENNPVHKK